MVLVDIDAAIDHHADFPDLLVDTACNVVFPDKFLKVMADEDSDIQSLDAEDIFLEDILSESPKAVINNPANAVYPTKERPIHWEREQDDDSSNTSKTVSDSNSPTLTPTDSPQSIVHRHVGRQVTLHDLSELERHAWDLNDLTQPALRGKGSDGGGNNKNDNDNNDNDDNDDNSDEDEESIDSECTTDLLLRARGRLHEQHLTEELESLKDQLVRKNEEIEILNGQLRRAISTKCDLVLAHTDLEICHERDLEVKDFHARELKRESLTQQEMRAEIEKEFMNEIMCLTRRMEEMTRCHECELLERDYQVAQLQQQLRDLTGSGMYCLE